MDVFKLFLAIGAIASLVSAEEPSASVRTAILIADAEKLYQTGKLSEAVELYDKAAAKAFGEGATGRAFELSRTSAAILQSLGKHREAGSRLCRLAMSNAQRPDAAKAHRAGIVCLAQAAKGDVEARKLYPAAMSDFLEEWSQDPAAGEVQWWLAKWRVARGEWQAAIALLESTPRDDPQYDESLLLLGSATAGRVRQLQHRSAPPKKILALVRRFTTNTQPIITGDSNHWPETWTNAQRNAAIALARVHRAYDGSDATYSYRLLKTAANASPELSSEWKSLAFPLLVEAALDVGEYEESLRWIKQLPTESAVACGRLAVTLDQKVVESSGQSEQIGRVLLALANRFGKSPNAPWTDRTKAVGYLATGRTHDASQRLAKLLEGNPNDIDLMHHYAVALLKMPGATSVEQSLRLWSKIESRCKPSTPRWRRARVARIQALNAAGKPEESEKLRRLTDALYPLPPSSTP